MMKKYLDANIFLNAVLYEDEKSKRCKEILINTAENKIEGITSSLTWDEVVYAIKKILGNQEAIEQGEKFLKIQNLEIVKVSTQELTKAQEIMKKYKIKPRDAIHAASAIINNCSEIISDDSDFDQIKEIKRVPVD